MIGTSVHQEERGAEMVACFRHGGEGCPRCDGTGRRPRRCCEGCGGPGGRPSEGGVGALMGLKNRRGRKQPLYCGKCHPELGGASAGALAILERLGA